MLLIGFQHYRLEENLDTYYLPIIQIILYYIVTLLLLKSIIVPTYIKLKKKMY